MLTQKQEKYDVGVIVGRFQTPELHSEHLELFKTVFNNHERVLVFLGISPLLSSRNNPLDFEARKAMILEAFPKATILYIKDTPDDSAWSHRLDQQIQDIISPELSVVLYGGRDSFIGHYNGIYSTIELESKKIISGREIRDKIKSQVLSSYDYRAGVIYAAYNRFATCFPTVDVAVLNENETEVLLIKKVFKKELMFPGGFASPTSSSYEADARREVDEELGIDITDPIYIGSFQINDWRYRSENDKIKTLFFKAKYFSGRLEVKDKFEQISAIQWVKLDDLLNVIQGEHRALAQMLLINLKK
jgi:bifunctional NMN adenylyltransferase/nudix hydrolase